MAMPVWFGGDYNPDQWPEAVWDDDVRLMNEAGVNLATVGVFSWAKLEPREGEFDFDWLDTVLDKLHAGGVRVDLATATASAPPWLSHNYPESLPVTKEGVTLWHGSRQSYCPSSPVYRRFARRLVEKLAERYGNHPALEYWHVNNEYGCHVSHCYCDESAAAFRRWLEAKYGSIEALNAAWGTAFWSQRYSEFAEVYPPRATPTFANPTHEIDFDRFSSDELLDLYRAEVEVLRAATPEVKITTNFMGFFKPADYWAWAAEVDFVSDDSYPDPADPRSPAYGAMTRDLVRSLKGGQSWLLMEQAPSAVNWRRRNAAKKAGQNRAWSYQCLARGADGILYFQWRQSVAGAEKFHSGLVPHSGTDTRQWREVVQLGSELKGLEKLIGTRVEAKVAIVFDWNAWWAVEQDAAPARIDYVPTIFAWYAALYERGVTVDFVQATSDLSDYAAVIAPVLFSVTDAGVENLAAYANDGGTLLVTYQSAILDENLTVRAGGYLGALQDALGVSIDEFAPLAGPDLTNAGDAPVPTVAISGASLGAFSGEQWSEFVRLLGAETVASFESGPASGWPAITVKRNGAGAAWYVATFPDEAARGRLIERLLDDAGVSGTLEVPIPGIEVVRRSGVVVAINHGESETTVPLAGTVLIGGAAGSTVTEILLEPQGVAVLEV
jgi:beta-galactosidase